MIHSYKDLMVWQRGIELVTATYDLTQSFPKEEAFGLTSQIRRAVVSIPTNIAEGRFRSTRKDFHQFLRIAYASGAELETELLIAENLKYTDKNKLEKVRGLLLEVMKMLNAIINKLRADKLTS